jgi:hypothetical protein
MRLHSVFEWRSCSELNELDLLQAIPTFRYSDGVLPNKHIDLVGRRDLSLFGVIFDTDVAKQNLNIQIDLVAEHQRTKKREYVRSTLHWRV